jgi:hypothetical protein
MFKDPSGKIVESDGKYSFEVQIDLLSYSIDYVIAKSYGNQKGMRLAQDKANALRVPSNEMGIMDNQAIQFSMHLSMAFIAADNSGLKQNSEEYGRFVTQYMINALYKIDEVEQNSVMSFVATALTGIGGAINNSCFTSDTIIKTKYGDKKIKDIKIGDYVLSEDVGTKEREYKKVKQLFISKTNKIIHITVNKEEIKTTENHPFYIEGYGWKRAKEINIGDKVRLSNDKSEIVENITLEKLNKNINVYNFEVEDWHTYFVSKKGILVHNICKNLSMPNMANKGHSKGGRMPANLKEELAMEEAMRNPSEGLPLGDKNNDPRWKASEGWTKRARNIKGIEIHYQYNVKTGEIDDFKIK